MIIIFSYFIYMTLAAIGITSGYHRYFAHKEFKATQWQEIIMLYCGLLCGGRSVLGWVGVHRMHHAYADTELDPHSPNINRVGEYFLVHGKLIQYRASI
jgi:stearoyl-CoA desaturase (delta-9 desaturase)